MKTKAFTLAELLIALAILGVIAVFTIPKVLTAQADQKNRAILKEALASVNAIVYNGAINNEMTGTNVGNYVLANIGATKICNSNSDTQGCWPTSTMGTGGSLSSNPGVILASGAAITGLQNCCASPYWTLRASVDANGINPPNQMGQDQMSFLIYLPGHPSKRPGWIEGYDGFGCTGSIALYNSIFSN